MDDLVTDDATTHGSPSVVFLHKSPLPHAAHTALAEQIGVSRTWELASSGLSGLPKALMNAWRLARCEQWDSLFAEGPCLEGTFLRALDRRHRVRVRLDMGSSSLRMGEFPVWERLARRIEMGSWSAIVVTGAEAAAATSRYVRPRTELIEWTPKAGWGDPFGMIVSDRAGRVVSIMQGLVGGSVSRTETRLRHKGLDRVAHVSNVGKSEGWGPVTVFGDWPQFVRDRFNRSLVFAGHRTADEMLRRASVLVHTSRQDGFGLAVLDAMVAGVPPVVSRAGVAQLVASVEPRLVVGQDPEEREALDAIRWVRALDQEAYERLANALRAEALRYLADPDVAVEQIRRRLGYGGGAA